MKKFFLLTIATCNILLLSAQGIYQLWGVRHVGGRDELGSIFSTDAYGNNFHTRYQIQAVNPGGNPVSSTMTLHNGKFYGVTSTGGKFDKGVIFEWDAANNTYSNKFNFDGLNGSAPSGILTLFGNKFYGIAARDNLYQSMIFEWDPATNIYTAKIKFIDNDGANPVGNLQLMGNKLYGMTSGGGSYAAGGIFEWDPLSNVYSKKVDFDPYGSGGYSPCGSLASSNGKFYGMTTYGGNNENKGVIFQWDPLTNEYQTKFSFDSDGYNPLGGLSLKGNKFYGLTSLGGINNLGTLFQWDPGANLFQKNIDLDAATGNLFFGALTSVGSKFYGMMQNGGSDNKGVIFEWETTSNFLTKKIDLTDTSGINPTGELTLGNGKFYGMTDVGGLTSRKGVIFEWDTTTNVYTKRIEFDRRENGVSPSRSLAYFNEKLYGMTAQGGKNDAGVIYEFDPATNIYSKKFDLDDIHASYPNGNLLLHGSKFYGMTKYGETGSGAGTIFEWDPGTNECIKKVVLDGINGTSPNAGLTAFNGKFYGMTFQGGNGPTSNGTIFEWNPSTNVYTKKFDFDVLNGEGPICNLTLLNNKFYGMTFEGGVNILGGVIFEWDPITNIYKKLVDFGGPAEDSKGYQPMGGLTAYNGKLYGTTNGGGPYSSGVIFELDPATNTFIKRFNFGGIGIDMYVPGFYPFGSLTMSSGKFYGVTSGGGDSINRYGVLFEWDPATNVYTKKQNLTDHESGWFEKGKDLTLAPAPLALRTAGSCMNFPAVSIDNTNNNVWVPIIDSLGNAVAEINANGNTLGLVNSSMYANSGPVREDASKKLYLDMNLTITPEFQPASPIGLRIYLKNAEYMSLKDAVSSDGQSSGIGSIQDIGIFKNDDGNCLSSISYLANPIATTNTSWQNDYVISTTTSSFSSFYFANKNYSALPLTLLEFNGRLLNKNGVLYWKTENEQNTKNFEIERSLDGYNFTLMGTTASIGTSGKHSYSFTDTKISTLSKTPIYYRLKQIDVGGRFTYSSIVIIRIDNTNAFMLFPNPVAEKAIVIISVTKAQQVNANIVDNAGRAIKKLNWNLPEGSSSLSIDVSKLPRGMYYFELKGSTIIEHTRFAKL